jgi:hypothetical protein
MELVLLGMRWINDKWWLLKLLLTLMFLLCVHMIWILDTGWLAKWLVQRDVLVLKLEVLQLAYNTVTNLWAFMGWFIQ